METLGLCYKNLTVELVNRYYNGIGEEGGAQAVSDTFVEVPIHVFLLLENRLLRDALERLFRKRADLQVVGSAEPEGCPSQALGKVNCDVVVLDYFYPGWFPRGEGTSEGESNVPKAVLIGMNDEPEQFLAAVRAGVVGYLLKEASAAEVVAAVRATFRGEAVCPPKLCASLFQFVSKAGARGLGASVNTLRPLLTLRQQKLIALVARGLTNKEIALRLNISEFTVKNHIHRILKNVDADSRSEAVEAVRLQGYTLSVGDETQSEQEESVALGT